MKRHAPKIFSLTIEFNERIFVVKTLKYAADDLEMFYKIALPSSLAEINLCWFSSSTRAVTLLMGNLDDCLVLALTEAIRKHETIPVINYTMNKLNLISA